MNRLAKLVSLVAVTSLVTLTSCCPQTNHGSSIGTTAATDVDLADENGAYINVHARMWTFFRTEAGDHQSLPDRAQYIAVAGRSDWVASGAPPFVLMRLDLSTPSPLPVVEAMFTIDPRRSATEMVAPLAIEAKTISSGTRTTVSHIDLSSKRFPVFGKNETLTLEYCSRKGPDLFVMQGYRADRPRKFSYDYPVYYLPPMSILRAQSETESGHGSVLSVQYPGAASSRGRVTKSWMLVFVDNAGYVAQVACDEEEQVSRILEVWYLRCGPACPSPELVSLTPNWDQGRKGIAADCPISGGGTVDSLHISVEDGAVSFAPHRSDARWQRPPLVARPLPQIEESHSDVADR